MLERPIKVDIGNDIRIHSVENAGAPLFNIPEYTEILLER